MKGYPDGWKPPKKKWRKAPCPPPDYDHGSERDYERRKKRREDQDLIREGLEEWENESE